MFSAACTSDVRFLATEGTEVSEPLPSPLSFFLFFTKNKMDLTTLVISVSSVTSVANDRSSHYRDVVTTGNTIRDGVVCE